MGDGDSLRRSFDEFLSQVLLLTIEMFPRDQVSQGSRKTPHPNPFPHPRMTLCASPPLGQIGAPLPHFPLSRRSRRARTLCLLPMLGGSLSISCSR